MIDLASKPKTRVTEHGVIIQREWFSGVEEVEVRRQNGAIVIVPLLSGDPIDSLGKHPVDDELTDASTNADGYLYSSE